MPALATALMLGVTVFAATNIDNIFVLLGFFADPKFRTHYIIVGQCLGIAALVLVSVVAALLAFAITRVHVRFLGLAPIAIGSKKLCDLWRGYETDKNPEERHAARGGQAFAVAAVTFVNGGDNIGVYTPLFAVRSGIDTAVIVSVFAVMTALWCAIAHWLAHHRTVEAPIRRYEPACGRLPAPAHLETRFQGLDVVDFPSIQFMPDLRWQKRGPRRRTA
jgi:cadmium resistance protein CadD (predicted permease)